MPRGRRPGPGTAEEKAAIRREKVRLNVQAYRKRKAAAEKCSEAVAKPSLRWVEDTKWQTEYAHQRRTGSVNDSSDCSSPATSSHFYADTDDADTDATSALVVASPRFTISPDLSKQYSLSILSSFPERFLPSQLSLPSMDDVQTLRTPCALWVTTATKQARTQESGGLNDVLHAIVLAVMGMEHQRPDVQVYAQRLYTRSLMKTRRSLVPVLANNTTATKTDVLTLLLSCHAAAVYELLINGSMADMLKHVTGISLLIEHQRRMPDFPSLAGDSLVEEYRMLEIHFCLLQRRLSVLGRIKERDRADGRVSHKAAPAETEAGLVAKLLDLADQIVPVMVELDSFTEDAPATAKRLMKLVQVALSLHAQLADWSTFLHDRSFPASPKSESSSDINEPVDLSQITQYEFASCYLFSLSYELHAVGVCVEAAEALWRRTQNLQGAQLAQPSAQILLLRTKSIGIARTVLELMPYFFRADKGIIGRSIAIWPLEAVWKALDLESQRLAVDAQVCKHTSASEEFEARTRTTQALVAMYYKQCRATGRSAQSYGLPLLLPRPLGEEDVAPPPVNSIDAKDTKGRVYSIDSIYESGE